MLGRLVSNKLADYIVKMSFPGHKGRPGKRGGSLPRTSGEYSDDVVSALGGKEYFDSLKPERKENWVNAVVSYQEAKGQAMDSLYNFAKGGNKVTVVSGMIALLGKLPVGKERHEALKILRSNGYPDLPNFVNAIEKPNAEEKRVQKGPYNFVLFNNRYIGISMAGAWQKTGEVPAKTVEEAKKALGLPKNWESIRYVPPDQDRMPSDF